jgi:hypothetical protein
VVAGLVEVVAGLVEVVAGLVEVVAGRAGPIPTRQQRANRDHHHN